LLHDRLHHGLQLPLVVRLLRHGLAHDQLQRAFHRDLGVIGLYEPVGPLHHPRLGIREIVLSLFGRLRGLRRRARRRGFLAGARLQRPLRLTDPWVAFRADAAFPKPEIYEALETRGVPYAIRIPANKTYKSFHYQADSWTTARRVVAKVEHHVGELFPRVGFIVTNLRSRIAPRALPETVGEERTEGGRSVRKNIGGACRASQFGPTGGFFDARSMREESRPSALWLM
jgi:hypothetical protein